MAKTMIEYEKGLKWINEKAINKEDAVYRLLDKNGKNQGNIFLDGKKNEASLYGMDNKDVTTFKDEHLPFAENILNELKPENISGVDYAISNDGDYYLGIDSIKNASDNNVKFDSGKIGLSPYAVSKDGKLYLGEDAIKNIPEDVVLKDVNINGCKNITEWNHKVEGGFFARNSGLAKNGPNAEFGESVFVGECENLTEWKHNVPGYFSATGSNLRTISPDVTLGAVNISFCKNLTEFNSKVRGGVFAHDSGLTTIDLDKVTIAGGHIDIKNTPLSEKTDITYIKKPEEKEALKDAIKSMDSKQEPEQAPKPEEEEYSMKM